jgi:hypothetical protein
MFKFLQIMTTQLILDKISNILINNQLIYKKNYESMQQ